jgi:type IV pilus assembly protein PilM
LLETQFKFDQFDFKKLPINFDFFEAKLPPLIGVDIGTSSVKMVELSDTGKNTYCVDRFATESLPKDCVVDGNIVNIEAAGESISKAWKKMGTKIKHVAMALPAAAVITKKIILQAGMSENEMSLAVEAEANQYIPFALDEVNLDFQVIGPSPSGPTEVEVLIAAARKEKVQDREAAAEAAGLKAVKMDVESFATQTAFELITSQLPNAGRDQTIALVDIGAAMMHVNVLNNGQSVYMRDQTFGGNQLTQEIVHRYNGETAVLGGIYEQTQRNDTDKVPLLGDLPVVGRIFRKDDLQDDKTELLIFITPRILQESLGIR